MEDNIDLLLFDDSNNLIEEISINKPKNYYILLDIIKKEFKQLPKYYNIFYQSENKQIQINNNEDYNKSKDILFIKQVDNLEESIFSLNYDKLSESRQEILDEKYNCSICYEKIKNEIPILCYQCQKVFHKNCLKNWNEKCKNLKRKFNCPKCKYEELPFMKWKEKINYEDERKNEANIINEINKNKFNENLNNNINRINDNKYIK